MIDNNPFIIVLMYCRSVLNIDFNYFGFTFTLFEVLVLDFVFALIGVCIGKLLNPKE